MEMEHFVKLKSKALIAKKTVKVRDFARFQLSSGYITVFEASGDGPSWIDNDMLVGKISSLEASKLDDSYNPSAVYLVKKDLDEYCNWLSGARLPSFEELVELGELEDPEIERSVGYEIFNCGEDSDFGFGLWLPSFSSVMNANIVNGSKCTYRDAIENSIIELSWDSPMTCFRIALSEDHFNK